MLILKTKNLCEYDPWKWKKVSLCRDIAYKIKCRVLVTSNCDLWTLSVSLPDFMSLMFFSIIFFICRSFSPPYPTVRRWSMAFYRNYKKNFLLQAPSSLFPKSHPMKLWVYSKGNFIFTPQPCAGIDFILDGQAGGWTGGRSAGWRLPLCPG